MAQLPVFFSESGPVIEGEGNYHPGYAYAWSLKIPLYRYFGFVIYNYFFENII